MISIFSFCALSKAYVCVNHELVIDKLAAYELNEGSLRLIQNYLLKKKIGSSLSEWLEIILGVPLGSISERLFYLTFS